jgi:RNA polymerase sigma-70 factor (ECF subfamily)
MKTCKHVSFILDVSTDAGLNTTNEKSLIQAAQLGHSEAFDLLVRRFDRPLLHLAFRITGSERDARSLYCETLLRLRADLAVLQFESSLCLYAYRILTNLCLDHLRTEARAMRPKPSRAGAALIALSPRERIVFELRHYQGLKLEAVSKLLNTTEEVARNILLRARAKLCVAMET